MILDPHFLRLKFFHRHIFWSNIFLVHRFTWGLNCVEPKTCFGPKLFLETKLFWTENCFGIKTFLDSTFVWYQNFTHSRAKLTPPSVAILTMLLYVFGPLKALFDDSLCDPCCSVFENNMFLQ